MMPDVIQAHQKYIYWQAQRYPFNLREDLIQEGYYGLMRAIQNFNPDKGVKLITYAIYYIKDYMLRYYLKNRQFFDEYNDDYMGKSVDYITPIYERQLLDRLPDALKALDTRELDIITSRYLQGDSLQLHRLGTRYNISEERTRQIEVKALHKLRGILDDTV